MWVLSLKIKKITESGIRKQEDQLVLESTVTLHFNDEAPRQFVGTRQHQKSLCLGALLAEGKIASFADVSYFEEENGVVIIKASSSSPSKSENPNYGMNILDIFALSGSVQEKSYLYKNTAVTHSAGLSIKGEVHFFAEDLSGQQAVYKAIGLACEAGADFASLTLFTTDKIDDALAQTAIQVGLPILVSRTGVTDKAFTLGQSKNLALVGFARGRRFNVYTDPQQRLNLSAI